MSAFNSSSLSTFRNDQYTITTSLSERHIIVKLVNNVSYVSYEGAFERNVFRHFGNLSAVGLPAVFKLINKCFAAFVEPPDAKTDSDYAVEIKFGRQSDDSGYIFIEFHCLVDGFLNVDFVLRLKETVGEDGAEMTTQLLAELNRQKQLVADLTARVAAMEARNAETVGRQNRMIVGLIERMEQMETRMTQTEQDLGSGVLVEFKPYRGLSSCGLSSYFPLNSKCIRLPDGIDHRWMKGELLQKMPTFYQLEHLIIYDYTFRHYTTELNHPSVKILELIIGPGDGIIIGLNLLNGFPKLKELHIHAVERNVGLNSDAEKYCVEHNIPIYFNGR